MSLSKEWTERHLTPRGWEEGSTQIDFGGIKEKTPPPDRVLTFRFTEERSSRFSKPDKWNEETWRSADSEAINELLTKFGPAPESL